MTLYTMTFLPIEIIGEIIHFYPSRVWFILNKTFNSLAFEYLNQQIQIPLFKEAAINGRHKLVEKMLLFKKIDPSLEDNYAIQFASENGHAEVVKLLLQDNRVDPSVDNNYAIRFAGENGHIEVVKL